MLATLVATLLLAQAQPPGPSFGTTFTPEAVASQLDGSAATLVVGAGPATPALKAATAALEEALRRSGKADLVMNGASLGPVAELDDPALVRRCEPLPVGRVVVVRVYESAAEPARAVVVAYDKRGAVQVAFTAQAGQPLAPGPKGSAPAAQGVPTGVAQSVLQVGSGQAQEEYERGYIGFEDLHAVNRYGSVVSWTTPYLGKYKRPLEGDEFYRIIGRDDLVAAYKANQAKRTAFISVGVVIGVVVPVVALASVDKKSCPPLGDPSWFDCEQANDRATMRAAITATLGVAAGLGVALIGAATTKLHPVDGAEARQLGDEYNKRLKAKLGLAEAEPVERPRPETQVMLSVAPVPGGGMVGLAVTF